MHTNSQTISPRQLAKAMGVSESSVKRWADAGMIEMTRTSGGHRRIGLNEAVRFIRSMHGQVADPAALGLMELAKSEIDDLQADPNVVLYDALLHGESERARGLMLSLYLQGLPLERLFDGPIAEALARIGSLWEHDEKGIFIEHRATDICVQMISQLRMLISVDGRGGPVAIGGTLENDPYIITSMMAATVLASAGWRDINLGPQMPLDSLLSAADEYQAKLIWLSINVCDSPRQLGKALCQWADGLKARDIRLVIGGRRCPDHVHLNHPNIQKVESMGELTVYGKGLLEAAGSGNRTLDGYTP